jgi:LysM repeat protein
MNRRQLAFIVLVNALVSIVIALSVTLLFEMRRPDPEELAAINTPRVEPVLAISGEPQITAPSAAASQNDAETSVGTTETGEEQFTETGSTNGDPAANGGEIQEDEEYVVQAGDSLFVIASRYNVTVDDIVRANDLPNPDSIFSGQRLIIPLQGRIAAQNIEPSAPLGEGVEIGDVENGGDLPSESLVIVNESNLAHSLLGWRLEREGGPSYDFGNVPLFPGSSVRVHTRNGEDSSIDLFWGQDEAQWPSNAVARLINSQGVEIHRLTVP